MKKPRTATVVTGLLILAIMTVVFLFSAQNAQESSHVSAGLLQHIINWFRPLVEGIAGRALSDLELETVLRKLGHFTEYAALGALCFLHLRTTSRRFAKSIAWGIAAFYACTDELHQILSEGRGASVTDVLIDASGALLGIMVLWGAICAVRRIRAHRQAS